MKQIKLVLGICVLAVIFLAGCKTAENVVPQQPDATVMPINPGLIDPLEVIETWSIAGYATMGGVPLYFYFNTNIEAKIKYAAVLVLYSEIFGYTYLLNGGIYLYIFNEETNQYKASPCNQENWLYAYNVYFKLGEGC